MPTLTPDTIDDLIYDARAGDLPALKEDIADLRTQHACPESEIVVSAADTEPEAEGGSGCCLLHFPAANGNIGASHPLPTHYIWMWMLGIRLGRGVRVCANDG